MHVKNNNLFGYEMDNETYENVIKKNEKYFFSLSDLSSSKSVSYLMNKKEIGYIYLRDEMKIDEDDVKVITTLSDLTLSSFSTLKYSNEKEDSIVEEISSSGENKIISQSEAIVSPMSSLEKGGEPTGTSMLSNGISLKKNEGYIKSFHLFSIFSINRLLLRSGIPCYFKFNY
jgi:hypothetical protein